MTVFLKILFFFLLFYFGIRMITKPFRDFLRQARKQGEMRSNEQPNSSKQKQESKTEDIGEYIDYEEVD